MAEYDIAGARQAGIPDADIAAALAPKVGYDLEGARKAGVPDREIADALVSKFNSTAGGAATGTAAPRRNPMAGRVSMEERLGTIGGAGAIGALAGFAAPEILQAGATVASGLPPPFSGLSGPLNFMSQATRAAGRTTSALAGGVGGITGETAGQAVELSGGSPTMAEVARIVGGGVGPELGGLAAWAIKNKMGLPAVANYLRGIAGKEVKLTEEQQRYLESQIASLRGGAKSDDALESVGSIMGKRGQELLDQADHQQIAALGQQGQVGRPGAFGAQPNADIGGRLRDVITTRNEAALTERSKQFKATEATRDLNIANREKAGYYIDRSPEYQDLVAYMEEQVKSRQNSPAVKAGYQKILDDVYNKGVGGDTSFNAIDQVRRSLGDVFRGKPAEGYAAVDANVAKDLYGRISNMQKKYAGPAQERLLDDYAADTKGLEMFSSKMGKKATALDQYRPEQYATDPSSLPSTYFKTRASVQALKELTGSNATTNEAALRYADKELTGLTAPQARSWMAKNGEWLAEVGPANRLVAKYVDRLEAAERSTANAQEFAKRAAADNTLLTRQSLPAQRAVDLIKSGDTELWGMVIPAIQASPQAKTEMVQAVRQVVSDQATAKGTGDLFSRNIRPFLEQSNIATKQEMDFIAQRLEAIQKMEVPEPEKLGILKRFLLQSSGSWASTAASRGAASIFKGIANQVPEEQPFLNPRNSMLNGVRG